MVPLIVVCLTIGCERMGKAIHWFKDYCVRWFLRERSGVQYAYRFRQLVFLLTAFFGRYHDLPHAARRLLFSLPLRVVCGAFSGLAVKCIFAAVWIRLLLPASCCFFFIESFMFGCVAALVHFPRSVLPAH